MASYGNMLPKIKSAKNTPQTQPLPGKESRMEKMAAGGYGFIAEDAARLNNILILGTTDKTYYTGAKEVFDTNNVWLKELVQRNGEMVVKQAVYVSDNGIAPKNTHAVYVLAMAYAYGDDKTRQLALEALPQVARIVTHLFQWIDLVKKIKAGHGWGSGMKRAVNKWYAQHRNTSLQVVKYLNREGWSHLDVMKLAHTRSYIGKNVMTAGNEAAIRFVLDGADKWNEFYSGDVELPEDAKIIRGKLLSNAATTLDEVVALITEYGLTHEMVSNQWKDNAKVWKALFPRMDIGALIRNLSKFAELGLFDDRDFTREVIAKLTNEELVKRGRIHPMNVVVAQVVFDKKHSRCGTIIDALSATTELSLKHTKKFVLPDGTPATVLFALDRSGSMSAGVMNDNLTANEAGIALGWVTARLTAPGNFNFITVDTGVNTDNLIRVNDSVLSNIRRVRATGGGTELDAVFVWAKTNDTTSDIIVLFSDNETYGQRHVDSAWNQYKRVNKKAKMINIQSTVNSALVDPKDDSVLLIAGWDTTFPVMMQAKLSGDI